MVVQEMESCNHLAIDSKMTRKTNGAGQRKAARKKIAGGDGGNGGNRGVDKWRSVCNHIKTML